MRQGPVGIDPDRLRFSWRIGGEGVRRQSGWQLLVSADLATLEGQNGEVWDSGKQDGTAMTHIAYGGAPLKEQTYYYWKVRIWDEAGEATDYSAPALFVTGIRGAWRAQWIWAAKPRLHDHIYLRKEIRLADKPVRSVLACVSADDIYKLYANGAFVGQGPYPSYPQLEQNYNGYELLPFVRQGEPLCLAVHAYYQGLRNYTFVSGDGLAGWIAQIRVVYEDGTSEWVASDDSWRLKRSEAYRWTHKLGYDTGFNEQIDAREMPQGWMEPGYDDQAWEQATVQEGSRWKLHAQETDVLTVLELEPLTTTREGRLLRFDMGREIVGTIRLTVEGRAGDQVELRLGEELDETGAVRFDMRCNCLYKDVWTLREGRQTIELYDYRAFRYGEVVALAEPVRLQRVDALVRHYSFDDGAASFESSDSDLNQLWDIAVYTTKIGTQELYMDCPSREKANYSLDTYMEMNAAYYVAGEWNLSRKMIEYFLQSDPGGKLRCVAPAGRDHYFTEYTMYPVLMAWRYYMYSGDLDFLLRQYEALCRVQRYMAAFAGASSLLERTNEALRDLVDWPPDRRDDHEMFPVNIVPNAVYVGMTDALARIAGELGYSEDAEMYAFAADRVRQAANRLLWCEADGVYRDGLDERMQRSRHASLHSNVFALVMGLVPEERKHAVVRYVRSRGLRGNLFLAMFLFESLFDNGAGDHALELLKAEDENGPMHMVRQGATTTWEVWDLAHKANASLCHPAGAFTAYVIGSRLMGVTPLAPGFSSVRIRPVAAGPRSASICVPTMRGPVEVALERGEGAVELEIRIPPNMTAEVEVPWTEDSNGPVLVNGIRMPGSREGDYLKLDTLGSGAYRIGIGKGV